jgi:hypothetical protein
MGAVRTSVVLALAYVSCLSVSFAGGEQEAPPSETKSSAMAACQRDFDSRFDACIAGGNSTNECLKSAASWWSRCMEKHGYDVESSLPSSVYESALRKERPTPNAPAVAPATPTPSKREQVNGESVTTRPVGVAPSSPTPSKSSVGDGLGPIRRNIPTIPSKKPPPSQQTPPPQETPTPVPKS